MTKHYESDDTVEFGDPESDSGGGKVSKGKVGRGSYFKGYKNANRDIPAISQADHTIFGAGGYEGKPDTSGTGDGITGGTGLVEIPIISKYLPYTFGSTLDLGVTTGCSGSGYSGLTGASSGATYNDITYAFPDWSTTIIEGSTFGGIMLRNFFSLTGTSDNDLRQCCYTC